METITKSEILYGNLNIERFHRKTFMFIEVSANNRIGFQVEVESSPEVNFENINHSSFYFGANIHRSRYTWSPVKIIIKNSLINQNTDEIVDVINRAQDYQFLLDWLISDMKYNVVIETVDITGITTRKWLLYDSYIQEMNHQIVFDRVVGETTIKLNYNHFSLN